MTTPEKKARNKPLHGIFTTVPPRYDLANHVMTWYMDKGWRLRAARECLSLKPDRVLDLCCGTGDLAVYLAQMASEKVSITGLDYSLPMLEIATRKAGYLSGGEKPSFVYGDAVAMPFPEGSFDCVGISFAFRNLTYKNPLTPRCLAEVLRVLRPGGRFVIIDKSSNGTYILFEGKKKIHLKREEAQLVGKGVIFLGKKPDDDLSEAINFEIVL